MPGVDPDQIVHLLPGSGLQIEIKMVGNPFQLHVDSIILDKSLGFIARNEYIAIEGVHHSPLGNQLEQGLQRGSILGLPDTGPEDSRKHGTGRIDPIPSSVVLLLEGHESGS